jgi:hypothetical protein
MAPIYRHSHHSSTPSNTRNRSVILDQRFGSIEVLDATAAAPP